MKTNLAVVKWRLIVEVQLYYFLTAPKNYEALVIR